MPDSPEKLFLQGIYRDIFKSRSRQRIADWAYENIVLPKGEGGFSDLPYDVNRTPLVRTFFDWRQDGEIDGVPYHSFINMKGSQFGETLASAVSDAWAYVHDPINTAYVVDTQARSASIARLRFIPILKQGSPAIAADIAKFGEAAAVKVIRGASFLALGPTELTSHPLGVVHLDECALHQKMPEGTTFDLASKRTEKQPARWIHAFSKPEKWPIYHANSRENTLQLISDDSSIFTAQWMSGTQHVPMVPCPHCAGLQELTDEQLRAPGFLPGIAPETDLDLEEIARNAYYECIHCAHPIYDKHKEAMVRAYRMQPAPLDKKEARNRGFARPRMVANDPKVPELVNYRRPLPGVFSVHTSDLYNLTSKECTFGAILAKKLAAQRDPTAYAIYCKDVLGLPEPLQTSGNNSNLDARVLKRLCGPYKRLHILDPLTNQLRHRNGIDDDAPHHTIPCELDRLTIEIDYQEGATGQSSYFPFTLNAIDTKGRSWTLDYGRFDTLDQIEDALQIPFLTTSGEVTGIHFGLIDSQHDTGTVLEFCKRPAVYGILWPSAGVSRLSEIDKRDLTTKVGFPYWVYNYRSEYWEQQLYTWFLGKWCEILNPNNPGKLNSNDTQRHADICPRPYFPVDACDEFFDQISNMHYAPANRLQPEKGYTWQKIHPSKPNDYGDCLKLLLIIRRYFRNLDSKPSAAA